MTSAPVAVTPSVRARATDIRALFADALASQELVDRPFIVLSTSTCMAFLNGPYVFTAPSQAKFNADSLPYGVNELFFVRTRPDTPVLSYFQEERGMQFSFLNPMTYYRCPDVGYDLSNILATTLVRHFFGNELERFDRSLVREFRTFRENLQLLVYADEAERFVQKALRGSVAPDIRRQIEEFRLMFKHHGAGLDRIAGSIAETSESHLRARGTGVDIDTSLEFLFLTQSAFPSLYGMYNPSFGSIEFPQLRSIAPTTTPNVRYSQLRDSVERTVFVHDLRSFFDFER